VGPKFRAVAEWFIAIAIVHVPRGIPAAEKAREKNADSFDVFILDPVVTYLIKRDLR